MDVPPFFVRGMVDFHDGMAPNAKTFDRLTRAIGGAALLLGAVLALPGVAFRTAETAALWIALATGVAALVAAFAGKRTWHTGILVTLAAYLLFALRFVPNGIVPTLAALIGAGIAIETLLASATRRCPLCALLKIPSP